MPQPNDDISNIFCRDIYLIISGYCLPVEQFNDVLRELLKKVEKRMLALKKFITHTGAVIDIHNRTILVNHDEDSLELYTEFATHSKLSFEKLSNYAILITGIHYLVKWEILLLNIYRRNVFTRGVSYWIPTWLDINGEYWSPIPHKVNREEMSIFDKATQNRYRDYPITDDRVTSYTNVQWYHDWIDDADVFDDVEVEIVDDENTDEVYFHDNSGEFL